MRISSKIHDYYDGLIDPSDKSLVFVRDPKSIKLNKDVLDQLPRSNTSTFNVDGKNYTFNELLVGFCGKIYPMVHLQIYKNGNVECEDHFCYTVEDLKKYIPVQLQDDITEKRHYRKINYKSWLLGQNYYNFNFYQMTNVLNNQKIFDLFRQYRIAYFLISHQGGEWVCESYPILKKIQFHKVHDAYEAIQNIEMYLNNELAPQDVVKALPISDKLKVETHGFDPKWSFRKMPEGKKK